MAENERLKNEVAELQGSGDASYKLEIERLTRKLKEFECCGDSIVGDSKLLSKKVNYLEQFLSQIQKEISQLQVRSAMAEEQVRSLNQIINNSTHNYSKQMIELKKQLGSRAPVRPSQQ